MDTPLKCVSSHLGRNEGFQVYLLKKSFRVRLRSLYEVFFSENPLKKWIEPWKMAKERGIDDFLVRGSPISKHPIEPIH